VVLLKIWGMGQVAEKEFLKKVSQEKMRLRLDNLFLMSPNFKLRYVEYKIVKPK
jgi:hypothetical protein